MSAALAEPIVQSDSSTQSLTLVPSPITTEPRRAPVDRHPLLPVFVAGAIAMTGALLLVGSILMWLALRHTGISAPW
jgi:hypothetical protein